MFGRKQRSNSVVDTLVGSNSRVNGDLNFTGGCHVDGLVKGNVNADPGSKKLSLLSRVRQSWTFTAIPTITEV